MELQDQELGKSEYIASIDVQAYLKEKNPVQWVVKTLDLQLPSSCQVSDITKLFQKLGLPEDQLSSFIQGFIKYSAKTLRTDMHFDDEGIEAFSAEFMEKLFAEEFVRHLPQKFGFENLEVVAKKLGLSVDDTNIQVLLFCLIKSEVFIRAKKVFVSSIDSSTHLYNQSLTAASRLTH